MNVRKEFLESAFCDLLGTLQLPEENLQDVRSRLVEAYALRKRIAALELSEIQTAVDNLEAKLKALHEAYVFEKKISKDTYEKLLADLQAEVSRKRIQKSDLAEESINFELLLDQALRSLSKMKTLWENADPEQRILVQRSVFPRGLCFSKNQSFGTPEDTHHISAFSLLRVPNSQMAVPRGIEPRFDG